jgi:ribosomal protein S18 acetylase RimI-like enzyme
MADRRYTLAPFDGQSPHLAAVDALYDRTWGQFGAQTEVWDHVGVPGFAGQLARAADGGIAGYVYGITAQPGDRWPTRVAAHLAPEVAARHLFGSFIVTELAVAPAHQRQGLGTALMRAVLAACRHPQATISTEYENTPARALYEGLGFVYLVERMTFRPQADGSGQESVVLHCALPLPGAVACCRGGGAGG